MVRGDLNRFGEALLACHASLYRYARAVSGDPAAAEELVQETYRRALGAKRRPAELSQQHVRPWLFTILRNHWYNTVRNTRDRCETALVEEDHVLAEDESPEQLLHRKFLRSEIVQAVDALPEPFREVFILREVEELSYAEIAGVIQSPVGTVMSRLARARAMLRRSLCAYSPPKREISR